MIDLARVPPHSVEMEQAVLGAMLLDARAIEQARDALRDLDGRAFYHEPHGRLYSAMVALYDRAQSVDALTLATELRQRGWLEECGGAAYLATLYMAVATAANVQHHLQIVIEMALYRHIIETTENLSRQAYNEAGEAHALLGQAVTRLTELSSTQQHGLRSLQDILQTVCALIDEAHRACGKGIGLHSGLAQLDRTTGGFLPGQLVIIGGRPSQGKTALALQFAEAAAQSVGVAFFSLEMSTEELGLRLLAQNTGLELHCLRTGALLDTEWARLTQHVGRLADKPLYVDDSGDLNVLQIRAECRQFQRNYPLGLVVVDYLQLMGSHRRTDSREQEVSSISRGLKNLAKELRVPILALSQLSRKVEERPDRRPRLSDLRESGSLEQDADLVLFIYRPETYGIATEEVYGVKESTVGIAEINLAKHRNGPTGSFWTRWDAQHVRFEHLLDRRYEDTPEAHEVVAIGQPTPN